MNWQTEFCLLNVTRNVSPLQGASLKEDSSILQTENELVLESK